MRIISELGEMQQVRKKLEKAHGEPHGKQAPTIGQPAFEANSPFRVSTCSSGTLN